MAPVYGTADADVPLRLLSRAFSVTDNKSTPGGLKTRDQRTYDQLKAKPFRTDERAIN